MTRINLEAFNDTPLGSSSGGVPMETHKPLVFLAGTAEGSDWPQEMAGRLSVDSIGPMATSYSFESQEMDQAAAKAQMSCYVITPKQNGFVAFADMFVEAIKNPDRTVVTFLDSDGGIQFNSDQKKAVAAIQESLSCGLGVKVFNNLDYAAKYINEEMLARHGANLNPEGQ